MCPPVGWADPSTELRAGTPARPYDVRAFAARNLLWLNPYEK